MAINHRNEGRESKDERAGKPSMPDRSSSSSVRHEVAREQDRMSERRMDERSRLRENDLYERQSI
jgi:hypothetical protein